MIELVKVSKVQGLPGHMLYVSFTNGEAGCADFSWVRESDWPMARPLTVPSYFERVFVSLGVPTWPNGFDVDTVQVHREISAEGRLSRQAA